MTKLIAEFCQNHNGNYDLLARMVDAAAKSGATHGKMQTIFANTISYRPQFEEGLIQNGVTKSIKRSYQDEYNRLKGLEITDQETQRFIKTCRDNGLTPMTTCFTRSHVSHLAELGFESIKVASYDCASFQLLRDLSRAFREIVVSTGATFDDEVKHAANILKDTNFAMLHCVTIYPTPLDQMNLERMDWLRNYAPIVGFSDHSKVSETNLLASKAALTVGAEIIERHFTLLSEKESKDGHVSINPVQLKDLADFSQLSSEEQESRMDSEYPEWRLMIPKKTGKMSDTELINRDYFRGRFASPRKDSVAGTKMIFNWEETPIQ